LKLVNLHSEKLIISTYLIVLKD